MTRYSNTCCHSSNARKGRCVMTGTVKSPPPPEKELEVSQAAINDLYQTSTTAPNSDLNICTLTCQPQGVDVIPCNYTSTALLCKKPYAPDGVWNLVCLHHWQNQSHPHAYMCCSKPESRSHHRLYMPTNEESVPHNMSDHSLPNR